MPTHPLRSTAAVYRLAVRVTEDEYRAVRALATSNSLTISNLVGEALAEFCGDLGEPSPLPRRRAHCARCPHRRRVIPI